MRVETVMNPAANRMTRNSRRPKKVTINPTWTRLFTGDASGATASAGSINTAEVAKFAKLSSEWWSPDGPFSLLHRMNPARVGYIRDQVEQRGIASMYETEHSVLSNVNRRAYPLAGMQMADIGSGGGILSEALFRLGANVTGVDAALENVRTATYHASQAPDFVESTEHPGSLQYRATTVEQLVSPSTSNVQSLAGTFDAVCALEVIEHVNQPREFLRNCSALLRPGGLLFLSTISRTPFAYLLTVTLAEDVLRLVDRGTHDFNKYIRPDEMCEALRSPDIGCEPLDVRGCVYLPWMNTWKVLDGRLGSLETQANYIMVARKA
ncbi:ubiquinone biosynthesis O-methyltransferase [Ramicandelaber brevisporus]|nr:ubiquinone biosynthesis O-methyltransferase [Ramicandelaber brevisporus]